MNLPRIAHVEPRLTQLTLYEIVTHPKVMRPGRQYTAEDVRNRVRMYTGQKRHVEAVTAALKEAVQNNRVLSSRVGTDDRRRVYWRPA